MSKAQKSRTNLVAAIFRNAGFSVTIKNDGIWVQLNRPVSTNEARLVLIQEEIDELCTITYNYNHRCPIVTIN